MKKIKRIIAALLLCILALSCTGCANLDEMKASHAIWSNEEQTELEWNGRTYKRLTANSNLEIWDYRQKTVFATTSDIPVLLAEQYGDRMECSNDEILLESHWYENDKPIYFCREDQYDAMIKMIVEGVEMTQMNYFYWMVKDQSTGMYSLTDAQKQAVETVLKTTPISLGNSGYDEDYNIELYRSAENLYFRQSIGLISAYMGKYRIIDFSEDLLYEIPDELQPTFAEIMKAYEGEYGYYFK